MWEFSLNIKNENRNWASKAKNSLSQYFNVVNGFVTTHENEDYYSILIAVEDGICELAKKKITSVIIDMICSDLKDKFLDKYLILPNQNKMGVIAFKQALLNFDRETDKFIIKKNLKLENDLFLESFFFFKLKTLQNKWNELVSLANENRDYLLTDESFIDLLKFLVDNLDICEDEISVVKEEGGYRIYADDKDYSSDLLNEEGIISSIIDLSPQKINLYTNETNSAIKLLEQIFDDRITKNNANFKNVKFK